MTLPTPPGQQKGAHRGRLLGLSIAVAVIVIVGVVVAVQLFHSSAGGSSDVARLKSTLDKVPLPAGASLIDERAQPAADGPATVTRMYQLPKSADVSAQIVSALKRADYRPVNTYTGADEPTQWSQVQQDSGRLSVQPDGHKGKGGIDLSWSASILNVSVDSLAIP